MGKWFGRKKKDGAGFTIMELLIAIMIFGIIAVIGTPGLIQWNRSLRVRGAVNGLMTDLQLGKVTAIRQNTRVTVALAVNGYTMRYTDRAGVVQTFRNVNLPSSVTIDAAPDNVADWNFSFNSRGYLNDLNWIFTVQGDGDGRRLEIIRTGKVNVESL